MLKKYSQFFFSARSSFFRLHAANFRSGPKSVMGDSLGSCGGMWCVQGPLDGTGDVVSLILPPPPRGWIFTSFHTQCYFFAHSHHIHSFSGLIALYHVDPEKARGE